MSDAKFNEQLAGWAIDRAIELYKIVPSPLLVEPDLTVGKIVHIPKPEQPEQIVTRYAEHFCKWIAANTKPAQEPELSEAEQAELAEHEKHLRGEGIPANNTPPTGDYDTEVHLDETKGNA